MQAPGNRSTDREEGRGRPWLTIGIMVVIMAAMAALFWIVQKRTYADGAPVPAGPTEMSP